jgi:hypothetical protein
MAKTTVRKRCEACGKAQSVRPRARVCREQIQRGFGWVTCGGRLASAQRRRHTQPELSPQEVATRKLAHARKMVADKTKQMRRLATALHAWEQKAARYARRASMTDAEVEAERARRAEAATRRAELRPRRAIRLGGGL